MAAAAVGGLCRRSGAAFRYAMLVLCVFESAGTRRPYAEPRLTQDSYRVSSFPSGVAAD